MRKQHQRGQEHLEEEPAEQAEQAQKLQPRPCCAMAARTRTQCIRRGCFTRKSLHGGSGSFGARRPRQREVAQAKGS